MIRRAEGQMFMVTLRAAPQVDGIRAIRWLLKTALRRFGLRCVDVQEAPAPRQPCAYRPIAPDKWCSR